MPAWYRVLKAKLNQVRRETRIDQNPFPLAVGIDHGNLIRTDLEKESWIKKPQI